MALWQAKIGMPGSYFVPPRMDLYLKFSSMLREIYGEYTNLVEPYGCDEAWLDVTDSAILKRGWKKNAEEISWRVKKRNWELQLASVFPGIRSSQSWEVIIKKPDGITAFSKGNYKELLWRLPAADLLYVGRSTRKTLDRYGIKTIGELALSDPEFLERLFGKMGLVLYSFANGWDDSPVSSQGYEAPMKSIGNSTTTPRDLVNNLDVQIVLMALSESVAARLRKHGFKCKVVSITIRDSGLFSFSRQKSWSAPTDITNEIMAAANALFIEHYNWQHPIRSLGIRAEKNWYWRIYQYSFLFVYKRGTTGKAGKNGSGRG